MSTKATKEIKLPRYLSADPEFWLETVDALLSTVTIDDKKKYEYIKSHLTSGDDYFLIHNFTQDPQHTDAKNMYQAFRSYVLEEMKKYEVETLKMTESYTSRDLKPSAALSHVNTLLSYGSKSIKRTVWLARLPRRIQKVVMAAILKDSAPMEEKSLDSLAALADGIAGYEKYHSWSALPADDTIVLPAYNENDPELWFYLLDEEFSVKNVTDDTVKYESTMKVLRITDIFTATLFLTELPNRTTNNQYANLRERVIKTFAIIKGDTVYRLVFRNIDGLKPSKFFRFLCDLAATSGKEIPQLIVRTLWMVQLPIKTQSILFNVMIASREPLQDLDMEGICLLADCAANSRKRMHTINGYMPTRDLDDKEVDAGVLDRELQMAKTLQEKITLGMRYCDYMYRVYYDNTPSESIQSCTVFRRNEPLSARAFQLDASDYFLQGCTCWYHKTYGEDAINCDQVQESCDSDE